MEGAANPEVILFYVETLDYYTDIRDSLKNYEYNNTQCSSASLNFYILLISADLCIISFTSQTF